MVHPQAGEGLFLNRWPLCLCASVVLSLSGVAWAAENLIPNPGFESGAGGKADQWKQTIVTRGGAAESSAALDDMEKGVILNGPTTIAGRSAADPASGDWAMLLAVDGSAEEPGEVYVESDRFPVTPATEYTLEFAARRGPENGPGLVGHYNILYYDSSGGLIEEQGYEDCYSELTLDPVPRTYAVTTPAQESGVASAVVRFQFAGGAQAEGDGAMAIDDVSFTAASGSGN